MSINGNNGQLSGYQGTEHDHHHLHNFLDASVVVRVNGLHRKIRHCRHPLGIPLDLMLYILIFVFQGANVEEAVTSVPAAQLYFPVYSPLIRLSHAATTSLQEFEYYWRTRV